MVRYLYSALFYLAMPFVLLRLLWQAWQGKPVFRGLSERFGYSDQADSQKALWIHAVSVGETIAVVPLIKAIQQKYPTIPILLTNMTTTGAQRARALLGDSVTYAYIPYDLPGAIKRFLRHHQPRLLILMETEVWPNLVHYCHQQAIPLVIVNARLSAKSARGYAKISRLTRQMLAKFSYIIAQSAADAERFHQLGATWAQLKVLGNIKFDQAVPAQTHEKAAYFKTLWQPNRCVWVAASTHEGEESLVLAAFQLVLAEFPQALLILVPRHPERFAKVQTLCVNAGFKTVLRSQNQPCTDEVAVFLGDSMGELCAYYAASEVAYVGGSLIPIGGHNILEPAALGIPCIVGPHMFNFAEVTTLMTPAIRQVRDVATLAASVCDLMRDRKLREVLSAKGREVVAANQGSLSKQAQIIYNLLEEERV